MSRLQATPLHVVQITDSHLGNPSGHMYGRPIDTLQTLTRVLDDIGRELPNADLMLVTGDVAQDPVPSSYEMMREALRGLPMPVRCLPGNHDDSRLIREVLSDADLNCARMVARGDWIVILLDSSVPGTAAGTLCQDELRILEEILSRHPQRHALICLHHPVMTVGTGWLDPLMLTNADALFEIIDHHPQVRGVLFGHIHQSFEAERNGVSILGTPSTCVQFLPHTRDFALDSLPPAWRQLTLHRDGRIDTQVHYLDDPLPARRSASS